MVKGARFRAWSLSAFGGSNPPPCIGELVAARRNAGKRTKAAKKAVKKVPRKKYEKGTKRNPVKIVFVCQAGNATSRRFAEAFEIYLEKHRPNLVGRIKIDYAGPTGANPNIWGIRRADIIYSTQPMDHLIGWYKKKHGVDFTRKFKRADFHILNSQMIRRILINIPLERPARQIVLETLAYKISFFYDGILHKLEKKYGIK